MITPYGVLFGITLWTLVVSFCGSILGAKEGFVESGTVGLAIWYIYGILFGSFIGCNYGIMVGLYLVTTVEKY